MTLEELCTRSDQLHRVWLTISKNDQLLNKHNKTKQEALHIASYQQGKRDAYLTASVMS